MHIEQLREYCLSKKGVSESFPFDSETLVFKVGGKIFLLTGINDKPLSFNIKCEPSNAIELREQYSCVVPGYHMNKQHWNTIIVDGSVGQVLLQQWIDESYQLIVTSLPLKTRKSLGL